MTEIGQKISQLYFNFVLNDFFYLLVYMFYYILCWWSTFALTQYEIKYLL